MPVAGKKNKLNNIPAPITQTAACMKRQADFDTGDIVVTLLPVVVTCGIQIFFTGNNLQKQYTFCCTKLKTTTCTKTDFNQAVKISMLGFILYFSRDQLRTLACIMGKIKILIPRKKIFTWVGSQQQTSPDLLVH